MNLSYTERLEELMKELPDIQLYNDSHRIGLFEGLSGDVVYMVMFGDPIIYPGYITETGDINLSGFPTPTKVEFKLVASKGPVLYYKET